MTDRPILFSGPMVRALLAGTKTQTRRIINPQPVSQGMKSYGESWQWNWPGKGFAGVTADQMAKFGAASGMTRIAVGDRLYVREAWRTWRWNDDLSPSALPNTIRKAWTENIFYEADGGESPADGKPRPGIHMPRWASRITLHVTDVRVQRLQEISEEDAIAEGIEQRVVGCVDGVDRNLWFGVPQAGNEGPVPAYADLWDSINNPRGLCADDNPLGWEANPWVAAYTFTVERGNIDQLGAAA